MKHIIQTTVTAACVQLIDTATPCLKMSFVIDNLGFTVSCRLDNNQPSDKLDIFLSVFGVSYLSQLVGKEICVIYEPCKPVNYIGDISQDKWINLAEFEKSKL